MRARTVFAAFGVMVMVLTIVGCDDPMGDALALEKDGNWEAALAIYDKVLANDPRDREALSGMATGLWLLGRYDEALTYQEKVVASDPDDVETRVELAFNYLNHQESAADAARVLRGAVAIERSARLLTYLGQALREAEDLRGAEDAFREAIAVDGTYGNAYHQLVRLLEEQGRSDEIASVLEEAEENGVNVTGGED